MYIRSILLEGFRSFIKAEAFFTEGINVIYGNNAQGKTSLLESVYYLSYGRSFRTRSDAELIKFGLDNARVKAQCFSFDRDKKIEITLKRGGKKKIAVNGINIKNLAELSESLCCVLFCPENLNLIQGGASIRRRLMDNAISRMRPKYAAALAEYNRLYEHKTRILKDYREKPSLLEALDDFNNVWSGKVRK